MFIIWWYKIIEWIETWPGRLYYGWKDFPRGTKFWYLIQLIGPWKYEKNIILPLRVHQKIWISFKLRGKRVKQHCVIIHTYIYQIGALKLRLLVRILDKWAIQLAVMGDNTGTSWFVILVLSPIKYSSPVGLFSN